MAGLFTKGGKGIGDIVITDAAIITEITTLANWNNKGNYTGSKVGLVSGNIYYDDYWNQKYRYDGLTLRRFTYNELID